jgi:heptosyltransferase-2
MPSLIVRLPNHLGDACMALPALDLLACRGHSLTLAGRKWAAELLAESAWPVIDLPPRRLARIGALRALRLREAQPPDALLLTNSFSSALEFRLAGLHPVGYARDGRSPLLRQAIPVPPAWRAGLHTIDYYYLLARTWLHLPAAPSPAPRLSLGAAARDRAAAALARRGIAARAAQAKSQHPQAGGYVVLCPVARGRHRGQDKRWSGFGRLCRQLRAQGVEVVICPGPGERGAAVAAVPEARVLDALDLQAFGALLAGSRLVVANDSGPAHLAAAVGARLLVVFGVTDPSETGPRGSDVHGAGGATGWPDYEEVAALAASLLAAPPPAAAPPAVFPAVSR